MATATSIAIKAKTQANDTTTTTVNYVNPDATSEQLQSLASAMNALTTNTIDTVTRIDKAVLGSEIEKMSRNLYATLFETETAITTLSAARLPTTTWGLDGNSAATLHFDGEASLEDFSVSMTQAADTTYIAVVLCDMDGEGFVAGVSKSEGGEVIVGSTFTVYMKETDTYQAASLTITIVA